MRSAHEPPASWDDGAGLRNSRTTRSAPPTTMTRTPRRDVVALAAQCCKGMATAWRRRTRYRAAGEAHRLGFASCCRRASGGADARGGGRARDAGAGGCAFPHKCSPSRVVGSTSTSPSSASTTTSSGAASPLPLPHTLPSVMSEVPPPAPAGDELDDARRRQPHPPPAPRASSPCRPTRRQPRAGGRPVPARRRLLASRRRAAHSAAGRRAAPATAAAAGSSCRCRWSTFLLMRTTLAWLAVRRQEHHRPHAGAREPEPPIAARRRERWCSTRRAAGRTRRSCSR